jgi:hypothetical protein
MNAYAIRTRAFTRASCLAKLFLLAALLLVCACRDNSIVKPVDASVVKSYREEQEACLKDAGSLAEADECTDAVKAKYGRK